MDITKMKSYKDTKPFKVDRNGTQYFADWTCRRCGGAGGADEWTYTGWTCYECGGSGMAAKPDIWKVYTPEYEAKLTARREARQAKRMEERKATADQRNAEYFEREGFDSNGGTWVFLGDTYKIREELKAAGAKYNGFLGWHSAQQIEGHRAVYATIEFDKDTCGVIYGYAPENARKALAEAKKALRDEDIGESKYVGAVGDRIETVFILAKSFHYETQFGIMYVHLLKDENNNVFVWKTSTGSLGMWEDEQDGGQRYHRVAEFGKCTIRGTIKAHTEYKGTKQNELTRCKVISIEG